MAKEDPVACPICGKAWGWTNGPLTSCDSLSYNLSKGVPPHAGPPIQATRLMVASVFDEPGHVAVYDVAKLAKPAIGVAFGEDGNSWRGDRYEASLRAAIEKGDSDGSVRVGPFAIPTERKAR